MPAQQCHMCVRHQDSDQLLYPTRRFDDFFWPHHHARRIGRWVPSIAYNIISFLNLCLNFSGMKYVDTQQPYLPLSTWRYLMWYGNQALSALRPMKSGCWYIPPCLGAFNHRSFVIALSTEVSHLFLLQTNSSILSPMRPSNWLKNGTCDASRHPHCLINHYISSRPNSDSHPLLRTLPLRLCCYVPTSRHSPTTPLFWGLHLYLLAGNESF